MVPVGLRRLARSYKKAASTEEVKIVTHYIKVLKQLGLVSVILPKSLFRLNTNVLVEPILAIA